MSTASTSPIRLAIAGVGNCASSLVQGLTSVSYTHLTLPTICSV